MNPEDWTRTVPIDLSVPWQITQRLSLKAELRGSTTLSLAGAPLVSASFASAGLTLGWSF